MWGHASQVPLTTADTGACVLVYLLSHALGIYLNIYILCIFDI